MPRTAHTRSRVRTPINEEPRGELRPERGDERGRVGDELAAGRRRLEFPPERAREAGTTGGELPGGTQDERDLTADDMAPETLLDEEPSRTPSAARGVRSPADRALRTTDAAGIGLGGGRDEAEDAERAPVGRAEAQRLARKAAEHASNPNFFEPAEAAERAERERRQRNRPA